MRSGRNFWKFYSRYTHFKQTKPHAFSFICSQVLVYTNFLDGQTDRRTDGQAVIFRKSFLFSYWSRIYIHVYTYLDYFPNFTTDDIFLTKVSIPFFHIGNRIEPTTFRTGKLVFSSSTLETWTWDRFGWQAWECRTETMQNQCNNNNKINNKVNGFHVSFC